MLTDDEKQVLERLAKTSEDIHELVEVVASLTRVLDFQADTMNVRNFLAKREAERQSQRPRVFNPGPDDAA